MRAFNKIFGIGLSRTGTSSLTAALESLDIPTIHWPLSMAAICQSRAATDITVSCRFEELDRLFPNSLFIYTERDMESWLASVAKHYEATAKPTSVLSRLLIHYRVFAQEAEIRLYGGIHPTREEFQAAYARHHEKVLRWAQGRENRLLRMNIVGGDGWPQLCPFLEIAAREQPFPWKNRHNPASLATGSEPGIGPAP